MQNYKKRLTPKPKGLTIVGKIDLKNKISNKKEIKEETTTKSPKNITKKPFKKKFNKKAGFYCKKRKKFFKENDILPPDLIVNLLTSKGFKVR